MLSLGEELKRERQDRSISLREVSEATKINVRILEAIETNNFKLLPGGVFNRNFIRVYAQFIGVDPEIAVRKYQDQTSSRLESTIPPFLKKGTSDPEGSPTGRKKIYFAFGALIVVAVAIWFFFFQKANLFPL